MRGYLKFAGMIHQCTRCYALRIKNEPAACPTCKALLNEVTTATRPLSLADVSDDAPICAGQRSLQR